jgi:hypothetical protein
LAAPIQTSLRVPSRRYGFAGDWRAGAGTLFPNWVNGSFQRPENAGLKQGNRISPVNRLNRELGRKVIEASCHMAANPNGRPVVVVKPDFK